MARILGFYKGAGRGGIGVGIGAGGKEGVKGVKGGKGLYWGAGGVEWRGTEGKS